MYIRICIRVYMYVCVYIYMCVCVCMYIRICIRVYMYAHVYIYVYVYICVYMHIYIRMIYITLAHCADSAHSNTCTHTVVHAYMKMLVDQEKVIRIVSHA